MDELAFPLAHDLSAPAHHRVVKHRSAAVRNHQVLVDAGHVAESLAGGAGSQGIVEIEHQVVRLLKLHSVQLKALGETVFGQRPVLLPNRDDALVLTFVERRLQRVQHAHLVVAAVGDGQAVDEQAVILGNGFLAAGQNLGNVHKPAVARHQPGIAALDKDVELGAQVAPLGHDDLGQQRQAGAVGVGVDGVDDVVGGMLFHDLTRHGRVGLAHAGEQQPQVVIDLGARAHRAARVARHGALLHSNGGWQAGDEVTVGLGHAAHELAGIG